MESNDTLTCSPDDNNISKSLMLGFLDTFELKLTNLSVESPIADKTTTNFLLELYSSIRFSAILEIFAIEATEVPPYFFTTNSFCNIKDLF